MPSWHLRCYPSCPLPYTAQPASALHWSRGSNVDSQPRSCGHPSEQSPKALTPPPQSSLRYRSASWPTLTLILALGRPRVPALRSPADLILYMPFPSSTVPFPGVLLDFALYHCDRSATTRREVSIEGGISRRGGNVSSSSYSNGRMVTRFSFEENVPSLSLPLLQRYRRTMLCGVFKPLKDSDIQRCIHRSLSPMGSIFNVISAAEG